LAGKNNTAINKTTTTEPTLERINFLLLGKDAAAPRPTVLDRTTGIATKD
jgi:hypothetical protein